MRIGIDLGGTKIEGIALDDDGRERARLRVGTPSGDYDGTLSKVADLVGDLERRAGPARTIGVGIPGAISPASGLVKNANSTWLNGRRLDHDLSRQLGRAVRVANDANCFAVSEAMDGAAAAPGAGTAAGTPASTATAAPATGRAPPCASSFTCT